MAAGSAGDDHPEGGEGGIAAMTTSRSVGTVRRLTDVDIPAASGFSACAA